MLRNSNNPTKLANLRKEYLTRGCLKLKKKRKEKKNKEGRKEGRKEETSTWFAFISMQTGANRRIHEETVAAWRRVILHRGIYNRSDSVEKLVCVGFHAVHVVFVAFHEPNIMHVGDRVSLQVHLL